jgi:hypothetical protein
MKLRRNARMQMQKQVRYLLEDLSHRMRREFQEFGDYK